MTIRGGYDVDLRSLIDVLGTNLYSNPGVYVRELLQNAIDAQTVAGKSTSAIDIDVDGDTFTLTDRGTGMSPDVIGDLLGTIGRSSKRDELGFSTEDTIGQFGVGMLSAFLVADEVAVDSLAPGHPPVRWTGSMTGSFEVDAGHRTEPGTTITLRVRRGSDKWVSADAVRSLATEYAGLHPTPIRVNGEPLTMPANPFGPGTNAGDLAARRIGFCQDEFGFTPLESFEVEVGQAGLRGVAFVRPGSSGTSHRSGHRCYVKGLAVGDVPDLLPDWAYFVRLVVDASALSLTASREGLVKDELFTEVRDSLAAQVQEWLIGLGTNTSVRERFLSVHEMGIKAIATGTPELLRFVDRHCLFETNFGAMAPSAFRARFTTMRYTASVDDFRVLGDILAHRGVGLINAGHAFESGVLRELVRANPDLSCEVIGQEYLLNTIATPTPDVRDEYARLLDAARTALLRFGCRVELGSFEPETLASLLITDDSAQLANDRAQMLAEVDGEPDVWLSALSSLEDDAPAVDTRPALVLNTGNPLIKRLNHIADTTVQGAVLRTLYGQAAIRTRRPVRGSVAAEVDDALTTLAELATRTEKS
ncbi:HSP90 family protein [Gordonia sp. NPDC003950]